MMSTADSYLLVSVQTVVSDLGKTFHPQMSEKQEILFSRIASVVLALGALSGCAETEQPLEKVTVCEVTHSIFYAPQYVAMALGFFEEEGLDVELSNGGGADKVMSAVLSGSIDIGFAGPEASIYVYNEGKEDYTQVFAQVTRRDGSFLVAREPDEAFTWDKLKGCLLYTSRCV